MKTLACVAAILPSVVFGGVLTLPDQPFDEKVDNEIETVLTFDQFDDLGGARILTSVRLTLDARLSVAATAENTSDGTNTLTLDLVGGEVVASGPGTSGLVASTDFSDFEAISETVEAFDGTFGSGPDFHDFGTVTTDAHTGSDETAADLGAFTGTGTVSIAVDAGGAFGVGGTADVMGSVDVMRTLGTVGLEYVYATPEPASFLLLFSGLGGMFMGRRRRPQGSSGEVLS